MAIGPIIEVLIGLIFVYFVFSVLCSGVNEFVSRRLEKRSVFLAQGVWQMLDNNDSDVQDSIFQQFWKHPLVSQLGQSGARKHEGAPAVLDRVLGVFTAKPAKAAAAEVPNRPADEARDTRRPSYVPTATFVTVMAELLETN